MYMNEGLTLFMMGYLVVSEAKDKRKAIGEVQNAFVTSRKHGKLKNHSIFTLFYYGAI